jgi:hypothetical protein
MNKKIIQLGLGLAAGAFCIWLAFYLGGVTVEQLISAIKQTNWLYALPMAAVTMASFYWRTFRWQILLAPLQDIPSYRLYGPLMIGFAFNNILPARAGEIARPLALTKQEKVPFGAGLSTIIVERLVDVITLLVLMITMPLYITLDATVYRSYTVGDTEFKIGAQFIQDKMPVLSIVSLVLLAGITSFLIPAAKNFYIWILRILPLIPAFVKEKLEAFINSFADGLASLRSIRALSLMILHSAIIWASVAFSFQLMSWGFPGLALTFGQALGFLIVTCIVISIPGPPGFWGVYEFGGMVALLMMGVVPDTPKGAADAFAFSIIVHFLQWVPITLYGLWAAAKLSISSDLPETVLAEESGEPLPIPEQQA